MSSLESRAESIILRAANPFGRRGWKALGPDIRAAFVRAEMLRVVMQQDMRTAEVFENLVALGQMVERVLEGQEDEGE